MLDALEQTLGRGGRARGQWPGPLRLPIPLWSPIPLRLPSPLRSPSPSRSPSPVADPVTVLDALEHMFASCSMHSTTFEAILNETKMMG